MNIMIRSLVLAAALLTAATVSPLADGEMTLAHIGGAISPHRIAANAFIAEVERRLPGRFLIEHKGGTMMGGEADIWQALRLGAVDITILTAGAITPFVWQLGVLNVPFLFRDIDHADAVLNGPIGQSLGHEIDAHGAVFLGFVQRGFNQLTNSKRPVLGPADLAGLRIRVIPNPVYEATFKALGAEVVPMAWPGVYGALDDGRIDGQDNPLLALAGQYFHRVQKYLSLTGLSQSPMVFIINADTFASLTAEEQGIFQAAARAGATASLQAVARGESAMIEEFRREGLTITETVDRDAFRAALAPLEAEWKRRFGAEVLDLIRKAESPTPGTPGSTATIGD